MSQELEDKEMQGNTQPLINTQEKERIRQSEDQQMDTDADQNARGNRKRVAETTDPEAEGERESDLKKEEQQGSDDEMIPVQSAPKPGDQQQQDQSKNRNKNMTNEQVENFIKCEIKDVPQFRVCLESVKFPKSGAIKNQFNDVILQAHQSGIVLKSASNSGVIMTRCMIRKEFFVEGQYNIEIRNEADRKREEDENKPGGLGKPLIEFCLPISELKQIVDGIMDDENCLQIQYPSDDNYLKVEIPEETKGSADKICQTTVLQLETFEAQHTLDPEFNLNNNQNLAQVFGKVQHFKKALKEFSFLQDKEIVELRFSDAYPHLQFIYGNTAFNRYHVVKFNSNIDDLVYKKTSEANALYTIESLRLAFSRITSDNLLCIVTLQNEGYLSVKHMHQEKLLLIESIILAQEDNQEDQN